MNERIKELMSKTLDEKFAGTWSTMDMQDLAKFSERFAKLIIKECVDIVSGTAVDTPPNDLFYGYNLGVNKAAENIKERFRIEELSPFNTVNS